VVTTMTTRTPARSRDEDRERALRWLAEQLRWERLLEGLRTGRGVEAGRKAA
jgi:hypothetical protein